MALKPLFAILIFCLFSWIPLAGAVEKAVPTPRARPDSAPQAKSSCDDLPANKAALRACRQYKDFLNAYGDPRDPNEERYCIQFYNEAFKFRDLTCDYDKELVAFAKKYELGAKKKSVNDQLSTLTNSLDMNAGLAAIHKKYGASIHQQAMLAAFRNKEALDSLRTPLYEHIFRQFRDEAQCMERQFSKMPSFVMAGAEMENKKALERAMKSIWKIDGEIQKYAGENGTKHQHLAEASKSLKEGLGAGRDAPKPTKDKLPASPDPKEDDIEIKSLSDIIPSMDDLQSWVMYGGIGLGAGSAAAGGTALGAAAPVAVGLLSLAGGRVIYVIVKNHDVRTETLKKFGPEYLKAHPKANAAEMTKAFCEKYQYFDPKKLKKLKGDDSEE